MRPDAIRFPPSYSIPVKPGPPSTINDRVTIVSAITDPLLEVDRTKGEKSHMRRMPHDGSIFVTRDPADTMYYPTWHDRGGQSRYRWEPQADGVELGYLVETADA